MTLKSGVRAFALFLLVFFAGSVTVSDFQADSARLSNPAQKRLLPVEAIQSALGELSKRGLDLKAQGIYIESLQGNYEPATHNPDILFNPASVAKLATSYFALSKLGPDFRFSTRAGYTGSWDSQTQTVLGDLVLHSDGDPLFRPGEAKEFANQRSNRGVRKVEGDLLIRGALCLNGNYSREESAARMEWLLKRAGLKIEGNVLLEHETGGDVSGDDVHWMLDRRSAPLREILWHVNAHSVNVIAERLGAALGGPSAMEDFLKQQTGLSHNEMFFSTHSGLEANGLTPRATIRLLRSLHRWLEAHGLSYLDILPVAGVDEGTLSDRFREDAYRGCIVGKTGTLTSEGGVSTLAGIVYTRSGPFFVALYNERGDVNFYRDWQDLLLKRFMDAMGGGVRFKQHPRTPIDVYSSVTFETRPQHSRRQYYRPLMDQIV